MKHIKRWLSKSIDTALKTRRVLLLSGARQCGKTTLSKSKLTPEVSYRTLDDITLLAAAKQDPQSFVQHQRSMLIIDEIQRVPELLFAIKKIVDENNRPGQFLITGSSNLQSSPGVNESLAGRLRKIRLRPLTQGEIINASPSFIEHVFNENFEYNATTVDRNGIIELALRGGYPEVIHFDYKDRALWHQDYLTALLERDLADITNIRRADVMNELLRVLSAWSSKYMDYSAIGAKLSIKRPTLESYINALCALYLFDKVPPWTKTDYDRVGKKPKLFSSDSGLMASTLNWHTNRVAFEVDRLGKLVETFIYNELSAQIDASEGEYTLYHYRDREKREIDFIIEHSNGDLIGIEVKAGTTIKKESFKHLQWFKDNLVGTDRKFIGVVLYAGDEVHRFGKSMWCVPMSRLWPLC